MHYLLQRVVLLVVSLNEKLDDTLDAYRPALFLP